jgi:hypothetical protein
MPHLTDLTGLASVASAMTASLLLLPHIARLPKQQLAKWLGACFVLVLIPIGGLPLAGYVRGATGDLSITTQLLLWSALLTPWLVNVQIEAGARRSLLMLVAAAALFLYPLALGLGMFDPYRIGYGDPLFITALLLLALLAWFYQRQLLTLSIALATLAWSLGWHESDNLWDYLLDPFLAIYALGAIALHTAKGLIERLRQKAGERPG